MFKIKKIILFLFIYAYFFSCNSFPHIKLSNSSIAKLFTSLKHSPQKIGRRLSNVSSFDYQRSDRSDSLDSVETFNSESTQPEYDSDGYLTDDSNLSSGSTSSAVSFISDDSINYFNQAVEKYHEYLPNLKIEINGNNKSFEEVLCLIMQAVFDDNILLADKLLLILTNTISLNMFLFVDNEVQIKLKKVLRVFIYNLNFDIHSLKSIKNLSFFSKDSFFSKESKFFLIESIGLIKKNFPNSTISLTLDKKIGFNDCLVSIGIAIIAGLFKEALNNFLTLLYYISLEDQWVYATIDEKYVFRNALFDFVNSLNDKRLRDESLHSKFFYL